MLWPWIGHPAGVTEQSPYASTLRAHPGMAGNVIPLNPNGVTQVRTSRIEGNPVGVPALAPTEFTSVEP